MRKRNYYIICLFPIVDSFSVVIVENWEGFGRIWVGAKRPDGMDGSPFPSSGPDHIWLTNEPVMWTYLINQGWTYGDEPKHPRSEVGVGFQYSSADDCVQFMDLGIGYKFNFMCEYFM